MFVTQNSILFRNRGLYRIIEAGQEIPQECWDSITEEAQIELIEQGLVSEDEAIVEVEAPAAPGEVDLPPVQIATGEAESRRIEIKPFQADARTQAIETKDAALERMLAEEEAGDLS